MRDEEVRIRLGDRRWRIRGLEKATTYDSLHLNLPPHAWSATRARLDQAQLAAEYGPVTIPPKDGRAASAG